MIIHWLIRRRDAAAAAWLANPTRRGTYRRLAAWDTLLTRIAGRR